MPCSAVSVGGRRGKPGSSSLSSASFLPALWAEARLWKGVFCLILWAACAAFVVLANAQITAFPMGQAGWISPCFLQRKRDRQRLLLNRRIVSSDCPCVCRGGGEDKEGLGEGKLCWDLSATSQKQLRAPTISGLYFCCFPWLFESGSILCSPDFLWQSIYSVTSMQT